MRFKIIIILFWLCVIGALAYSPYLLSPFFDSEKEMSIFTFSDMISEEAVREFKKLYGIDVHLTYFEHDGDLLAKMGITQGKGYDLIIGSDTTIKVLREKGFLKKINSSSFINFDSIDKRLLGRHFDPKNEYSIPFMWELYVIAYDKEIFGELKDVGWDLIFKNPASLGKDYKIAMTDEPRDALFFSSLYLFGSGNNITTKNLDKIKKILIKQKKWVEVYTTDMQDYYLMSGASAMAVTPGSFMKRVYRETDQFGSIIPREGSLMNIYSMALPIASTKEEAASKFIDFMMMREQAALCSNKFGYFPANMEAYDLLDEDFEKIGLVSEKMFEKLSTVQDELSGRQIEDLWLSVKAA